STAAWSPPSGSSMRSASPTCRHYEAIALDRLHAIRSRVLRRAAAHCDRRPVRLTQLALRATGAARLGMGVAHSRDRRQPRLRLALSDLLRCERVPTAKDALLRGAGALLPLRDHRLFGRRPTLLASPRIHRGMALRSPAIRLSRPLPPPARRAAARRGSAGRSAPLPLDSLSAALLAHASAAALRVVRRRRLPAARRVEARLRRRLALCGRGGPLPRERRREALGGTGAERRQEPTSADDGAYVVR